jgi:hypothetical protein
LRVELIVSLNLNVQLEMLFAICAIKLAIFQGFVNRQEGFHDNRKVLVLYSFLAERELDTFAFAFSLLWLYLLLFACPRGNSERTRTPIVAELFLAIDKPLTNDRFYCTDGKQHF